MLKMLPENLIPIGIFVILIGFIIVLVGAIMSTKGSKTKVDWVFGGFIGPVPFGVASREDWLKFIIVLSIIFLFVFILSNKLV